ncbi:methyltransferase domain-containing protein [Maribacter sp. MMG018]|uniref:class I SAM-dependent methyltransferase n=1 Tax=Maribacter sp. MMG018 TaxID=2822688 RepID=UPI001B3797E3|nr:class I SAM-dependent methyltransferase [Maribacter sp. MMG018]MBQ4914039.1 methyltransferase domain-containing protein [Maribacter sp. MMG018]
MDKPILDSWNKNAEEWIKIIDNDKIPSRVFTNKAIIKAIEKDSGEKILDIGCGEGWLTRSISNMGKHAVGFDATEALLKNARKKGSEEYYNITYDEIVNGKAHPLAPFDTAIFNFSLYQEKGLETLLKKVKELLTSNGTIIIQTLHPYFLIANGGNYQSRSISDSWKGLPGNFTDGHDWYARTFEDWTKVINVAGLHIIDLREVTNNENTPISLIIKAS